LHQQVIQFFRGRIGLLLRADKTNPGLSACAQEVSIFQAG
jgi:hypothetical protein